MNWKKIYYCNIGGKIMGKYKPFYPSESSLSVLYEVIDEISIILHYPVRVLRNSKFRIIDWSMGESSFLNMYPRENRLENFLLTTGPVLPIYVDNYIRKRTLRKQKQEIQITLLQQQIEVKNMLLDKQDSERKEILEISKKVLDKVLSELKSDLLN